MDKQLLEQDPATQSPPQKSSQIGEKLLESTEAHNRRRLLGQIRVFALTYMGYSLIHFQRQFWSIGKTYLTDRHPELNKSVLSRFDAAELCSYAIFLYVCGIIGDKYNPRILLTIAWFGIGVFFALLALGGYFEITSQVYYYPVFIGIGMFNSFLFPNCVPILAKWFPKKSRGLFVGFWASCNNCGNLVGIQVGTALQEVYGNQWEALQAYAALFVIVWSVLIFAFLVPDPKAVGIQIEDSSEVELIKTQNVAAEQDFENKKLDNIAEPDKGQSVLKPAEPVSFFQAWLLPGVILYGASFFCTKMAVYCLLFRLPTFFREAMGYQKHQIANVSNLLDIGALVGSAVIGGSSDLTHGKRSPSACVTVVIASIVTATFVILGPDYSSLPTSTILILMFLLGFCINGLNNVISSACSADLGKQEALQGNDRGTSTVTGIIDGTGTMGAAFGQLLVSFTQRGNEWRYGYFLVIAIDISLTLIPVGIILSKEIAWMKNRKKQQGLTKQ
ncbi:hypothetical protein FGO68_gene9487 [Halteria grandinella]|uniref:Major facilitator superfamily (MFS) profile domain-containing protein n=1 Tax=Halteria grandinella TaxID=5974 RepID=A0A8J8T505_HALGN|nr:hypothetical protein FGO68_gene9487 [Halteria grandinella]